MLKSVSVGITECDSKRGIGHSISKAERLISTESGPWIPSAEKSMALGDEIRVIPDCWSAN